MNTSNSNSLKLLKDLLKKPYFSTNEARKLGVHPAMLAYLAKKGQLERLERGIYRANSAPELSDFRWEDLILKLAKIENEVVCQLSALAIYDLTEEIPRQHWIAIAHSTRHRSDPTVKIIRMRNLDLGKTQVAMSGVTIPRI